MKCLLFLIYFLEILARGAGIVVMLVDFRCFTCLPFMNCYVMISICTPNSSQNVEERNERRQLWRRGPASEDPHHAD